MTKGRISSFAAIAMGFSLASTPAFAQDNSDETDGFSGIYVGGSFGGAFQPNDGASSSILFDRDRNGSFGDTVTTSTGANAFSPGFCGGAATSTANVNCQGDKDGLEYMGRIGADHQSGKIVYGIVAEAGKSEHRDSVSAFSTTPAFYTMTRDLKWNAGIRGRLGFTPNNSTLFYGTGGVAYGKIRNTFATSNTANSFAISGKDDAWGYSAGGGVEQRIGRFAIGLEYLYTSLKDDKARINVGAGTAPPTNPFLLAGAGGTDFRRSDQNFRWHSMRVTATYRF